MTEEKNQSEKSQVKVELQIIPCDKNVALDKQNVEVLNHENQDDPPCNGKIILTVTTDTTKSTKADSGKIPDVDVSIHERCGSKLTKADSGKI